MARDFSDDLNPEQLRAATHGDGPLLIIAGAGTGKTRTLIYRLAHLIEAGVRPHHILLLTFTRRAAQEMLSRAERLVGNASKQVHGGTFHATAHRLLRRFGARAGIAPDFTIMDQGDSVDLMQLSRTTLGYARSKKRFPKAETLQSVYSRHINTGLSIDDILKNDYPQFVEYLQDFRKIFADYTSRKHDRNLLDYDDLLLSWSLLVGTPGALSDEITGLYDHILVDEYQDTNTIQAQILKGMSDPHGNITVVGDDAQSIYSFRGANFRNIVEFPDQHAETSVITLEHNYRSTPQILETTNCLIKSASERFTKSLWTENPPGDKPALIAALDEHHQTTYVIDRVLEYYNDGIALNEMAVLFRAGYLSAELEIELTNRKIPFEKWGGLKFLEAAHIKDVLAFLRISENPRDEVSWYRILQLLPGVGEVTARSAIQVISENAWDRMAFARQFKPPARAKEAHTALSTLIKDLAGINDSDVTQQLSRIRRLYDALLRKKYDRPEPRLADLDQLEIISANYPDRRAFLSALALDPPSATQDLAGPAGNSDDNDTLVLSTAHSAKGKEWTVVFIIWALDGLFPSSRSLHSEEETDEERRLMYVAMTRAKTHLHVTYPVNSYGYRRSSEYTIAQLSRFIDEDVRATMNQMGAAGVSSAETGGQEADPRPPVNPPIPDLDLRSLLKGRFS